MIDMQDPFSNLRNRNEITRRLNALISGIDFFSQSVKDNIQAVITLLLQEINILRTENEQLKKELEELRKSPRGEKSK